MYGSDENGGYGEDSIDAAMRAQETGSATGPVISPLTPTNPAYSTTPYQTKPLPAWQLRGQGAMPSSLRGSGPVVSPLQLSGLGEFSPAAVCALLALSRISWRFFNEVASGPSIQYLSTLAVWRSLYNQKRSTIAPGFNAAAQALLPTSLPAAEWSDAMRQAMAITLSGTLGNGHPALAALANLPPALSGVPAWLTSFRNALDAGDLESLRTYLEIPAVTGSSPEVVLARAVADDLRTCASPPAPPPPPATPVRVNPSSPATAPSGGQGGGGSGAPSQITRSAAPVSSSTGKLLGIGLLAIVGYGIYKATQDKSAPHPRTELHGATLGAGPKLLSAGVDALKEHARKVGEKDGEKAIREGRQCIPSVHTRKSFSMDEYGGVGADKLSSRITKLVDALPTGDRQRTGYEIEDVYYRAFVNELRKGAPDLPECE